MLRYLLVAIMTCALASCGSTPPRLAHEADPRASIDLPPPPPPAPPSLVPWAGRYRLTGEVLDDGCGGEVILAAGEIEIDAPARTLRADTVDREYDVEVEGDGLVATGRFPVESQCPESTVYERWELLRGADRRAVSDGQPTAAEARSAGAGVGCRHEWSDQCDRGLEGELLSTWLIWPGCMRVCTVRFGVRGEPL